MQRPKFSQPKLQDFRSKINEIVAVTTCTKHGAIEGDPCWFVVNDSKYWRAAICGTRISKRYNGTITQTSTNKRFKKEHS